MKSLRVPADGPRQNCDGHRRRGRRGARRIPLRATGIRSTAGTTVLSGLCFAAAAVGPTVSAAAQEGRREVEAGNRLYDEGRYQEAHARYLEALAKVPGLPLARFNEGSALYRSQEYQRAMEAFLEAAAGAGPEWHASAFYNLGNALIRQQQPGPAAEAYKQALRLDPGAEDARHNLELALRQLEQQQQQQAGEGRESGDPNEDEQGEGGGQGEPPPRDGREGDQENNPSQGEDGEPPQPQDGRPEGEPPPQDRESGEGQSGMPPPQMTPEQAERLLQAITEDPGEVNRKAAQVRGRRPRKDWQD